MTGLRKVLVLFAVLILSAFALPASAADKLFLLGVNAYKLDGTPLGGVIPPGVTSIVLVDYANQSPNGANSVIKSVDLFIPTQVAWSRLTSSNGKSYDVTVNTSPSSTTVSCPVPPKNLTPSTPTTLGSGADAASADITQNNITGVKPQGHYCMYLVVTTSATVCTVEKWRGDANTGNSITGGQPFDDFNIQTQPYSIAATGSACTGVLGCDFINNTNTKGGNLDPTADFAYGAPDAPDWGLIRGPNPDGSACTAVPYSFNLDKDNNTASFIVPDKLGQAYIAVEYVIVWSPVSVDSSGLTTGWTQKRPVFAWGSGLSTPSPTLPSYNTSDTNYGYFDYVPALACVVDDLSAGFGALPFMPNVPPFSADTYLQYQYLSMPGTPPSGQALMCAAQHGWTSIGSGQVRYWTKVIDFGDSWTHL